MKQQMQNIVYAAVFIAALAIGSILTGKPQTIMASQEAIDNNIQIQLTREYTKDDPLLLTYGTKGITEEIKVYIEDVIAENNEEIQGNGEDDCSSETKIEDEGKESEQMQGCPAIEDETIPVQVTHVDLVETKYFTIQTDEARFLQYIPKKACEEPQKTVLQIETDIGKVNKEIYIKVLPYPLRISSAVVEKEKIYNGNDEVDVKAALTTDDDFVADRQETDSLKQAVFYGYKSGKTDVVGEGKTQQFIFAPENLKNTSLHNDLQQNFTIKKGEKIEGVDIVIVKRLLLLQLADVTRPYRSLLYDCKGHDLQQLVSIKAATAKTGIVGKDPREQAEFVLPKVKDATVNEADKRNIKIKDQALYGEHKDALYLDFTQSNAGDNYTFSEAYEKGTLKITEERNAKAYAQIDIFQSSNLYRDIDGTMYFGKNAVLSATLTGGYTNIFLADGKDITDGWQLENGQNNNEKKSLQVYLERRKGDETEARTEIFSLEFIYDNAPPLFADTECSAENKQEEFEKNFYTNGDVTYAVRVKERFIKEIVVLLNGKTYTLKELELNKEALGIRSVHLKKEETEDLNCLTVCFFKDGAYDVYTKTTDAAGNATKDQGSRFVIDTVLPIVTAERIPRKKNVLQTDPNVIVKTTDEIYSAMDTPGFYVTVIKPNTAVWCAGIKTISCDIVNNTTGVRETKLLASFSNTVKKREWTGCVHIDPQKFYSNEVEFYLHVTDWATNHVDSEKYNIKIDAKAPKIKFVFDKTDGQKGKYYNKDKTLTIVVDERNFDRSYMPQIVSNTKDGYIVGNWQSKSDVNTMEIKFHKDGDYTVRYACTDLAGNTSDMLVLSEITIDKTKPKVDVTYDTPYVNGMHDKTAKTAQIKVTEHNFDPTAIEINISAKTDGVEGKKPQISSWSHKGDLHTATMVCAVDAEYTFEVFAKDMAGNDADPLQKQYFTVDSTPPLVEIKGVEMHSANSGKVEPVIRMQDRNFEHKSVRLSLTGANRGKINITKMIRIKKDAKGEVIQFADFAKGMDDLYTLTASAMDRAGNETIAEINFSVNREGSMYSYDTETKNLLKKKYVNTPKALNITEINVDTLTHSSVQLLKNGQVQELIEGNDYTLTISGDETSWKTYCYHINKSVFQEEGEYNLSFYSEDKADHKQTNAAKEKDIRFFIDKTSPVLSFSSIDNEGRYKADQKIFTLHVDDNIALDKTEYYLDGQLIRQFNETEIEAAGKTLKLTVPAKEQYQEIEIKVYDKAHNAPAVERLRVLVTENSWIQFKSRCGQKVMLYGGGAGLLLCSIAVLMWNILYRRKTFTRRSGQNHK